MVQTSSRTGLLLNFDVVCRKAWKSGLIMCLLLRAKLIHSILYNSEVKNLQNMVLRNGHPKHLFDIVNKFKAVNEPKPSNKNTENNFSYRLGVPYFGRPSYNFGCNIAKQVQC